jgi:cytochrome P450
MAFALAEMKIVLTTVLRRASLSLRPRGPLAVSRRTVTLFPKGGARITVGRVDARA